MLLQHIISILFARGISRAWKHSSGVSLLANARNVIQTRSPIEPVKWSSGLWSQSPLQRDDLFDPVHETDAGTQWNAIPSSNTWNASWFKEPCWQLLPQFIFIFLLTDAFWFRDCHALNASLILQMWLCHLAFCVGSAQMDRHPYHVAPCLHQLKSIWHLFVSLCCTDLSRLTLHCLCCDSSCTDALMSISSMCAALSGSTIKQ